RTAATAITIGRFIRAEYNARPAVIIETARLRLVPLTLPYVTSTPDAREVLARELGVEVAPSWPPELWDQDAQDWTRKMLEQDPATDWIPRCIVRREPGPIACG